MVVKPSFTTSYYVTRRIREEEDLAFERNSSQENLSWMTLMLTISRVHRVGMIVFAHRQQRRRKKTRKENVEERRNNNTHERRNDNEEIGASVVVGLLLLLSSSRLCL